MWIQITDYINNNGSEILLQIRTHFFISIIALLIAVLIGIPSGYAAYRSVRSEKIITAVFQVLRVIPSLAILVLLIPVMGTGVKPAVTALAILAVPPILLNTIVGFKEVPAFMIESAKGIGLTDSQVLWKVTVPQALPMIIVGIRTSLIEIIASATLAAKIGAGGLGEIIFTGLGLNRPGLLLIGGICVAGLSLGTGIIFDIFMKQFIRYGK